MQAVRAQAKQKARVEERKAELEYLASGAGLSFTPEITALAKNLYIATGGSTLPVEDRLSHWWCKNLAKRGAEPAPIGAQSAANASPSALRVPWSP